MNNLLISLRGFVEHKKKDILWTAASSVFISLFLFLVTFVPSIPSELAFSRKAEVERTQFWADRNRMVLLLDMAKRVNKSAREDLLHFIPTFVEVALLEPANMKKISEGLNKLTRTRHELAVAIGTISGMYLYNSNLSAFKAGVLEDLRSLSSQLEWVESLYATSLYEDHDEVVRIAKEIRTQTARFNETTAAILQRFTSFQRDSDDVISQWNISVEEYTAKENWYNRKCDLATFALLYLLGFIVMAFIRWYREYKNHVRIYKNAKNNTSKHKKQRGAKGGMKERIAR